MVQGQARRQQSRPSLGTFAKTTAICALLGSCIAPVTAQSAGDYYVRSLPGAPSPLLRMHAGHIEVEPTHHGNLFFWHFANRNIGKRPRTVLWLNGGPGCSSLDGALMEVGPYRIKGEELRIQEGSWDEYANLLFVDSPVGTGFSYVDTDSYLHELPDVAKHMVLFLEKFFGLFPEYLSDELYIAGESYAGQYIPYIAQAILEHNKAAAQKWNLSGLLIGNGWISTEDQYLAYLPYAYKENLIARGSPAATAIEKQQTACQAELAKGGKDHVNSRTCEGILTEILRQNHNDPSMKNQCLNMYDIRLRDEYASCGMNWPPDLKDLNPYLRRKDVIEALHINPDKITGWQECNDQVGAAFTAANSKPAVTLLPDILSQVPITLFSGDRDLICNHLGTEDLINKLSWNSGTGFEVSPGVTAPKLDWTFQNEPAGIYQQARNLTYVLFYNSSHMVPFDYPERSRDMLHRMFGGEDGVRSDSIIDGMPSLGGNGTSVPDKAAEEAKLKKARWDAYYRSGEVALVIVLIAAGLWGWFVYRQRQKAAASGGAYEGLFGAQNGAGGKGLRRDVEAADFDEAELDDLTGPSGKSRFRDEDESRFDVGDDDYSASEDEGTSGKGKGRATGR